jgi:hypothetical protein
MIELRIRNSVCMACDQRTRLGMCGKSGKPTLAHKMAGRCPLHKFPMEIPADYNPDTSPDSPRVGGCCDPPKP